MTQLLDELSARGITIHDPASANDSAHEPASCQRRIREMLKSELSCNALPFKAASRRDGQTDYPWVVGQRRVTVTIQT